MSQRERVNDIMLAIAKRAARRKPGRVTLRTTQRRQQVPGVDGRRRPLSAEHRAKLSTAHSHPRGPMSEVQRRAISEAQRRRCGVRMSDCHPDRKHFGRGKCRACYNRDYMRARRRKARRA